MKRSSYARILLLLGAAVVFVVALYGCSSGDSETAQKQAQNRQYMTQVNQIMVDFKDCLGDFTDAVSRSDVVGMRTQADNAFKAIDDLSTLEVPEDLADIQKEYVEGTEKLKEALSDYIDLYAEIEESQDFTWETYSERIAAINQLYNEGIEKLQSGDTKASEKN